MTDTPSERTRSPSRTVTGVGLRRRGPFTGLCAAEPDHLRELLGRIARGDQAAFAAFYDATSSAVFGMALSFISDRSLAESVTADVYVAAWTRAAEFDVTHGEPVSWMASIIARKRPRYSRGRSLTKRWMRPS